MELIEYFEQNAFVESECNGRITYKKHFIIKNKKIGIKFILPTEDELSFPVLSFVSKEVYYLFIFKRIGCISCFNYKNYTELNDDTNYIIKSIDKICNQINGILNTSIFFRTRVTRSFIPVDNSFFQNLEFPMLKISNSSVTFYHRKENKHEEFKKIIDYEPEALYLLYNN